ncbi:MAG: hypothetical protein V1740_08030 [Candidatus Woesearchaeota archaeon]
MSYREVRTDASKKELSIPENAYARVIRSRDGKTDGVYIDLLCNDAPFTPQLWCLGRLVHFDKEKFMEEVTKPITTQSGTSSTSAPLTYGLEFALAYLGVEQRQDISEALGDCIDQLRSRGVRTNAEINPPRPTDKGSTNGERKSPSYTSHGSWELRILAPDSTVMNPRYLE